MHCPDACWGSIVHTKLNTIRQQIMSVQVYEALTLGRDSGECKDEEEQSFQWNPESLFRNGRGPTTGSEDEPHLRSLKFTGHVTSTR